MPLLKKIFFSLKKLFSQKRREVPGKRKRRHSRRRTFKKKKAIVKRSAPRRSARVPKKSAKKPRPTTASKPLRLSQTSAVKVPSPSGELVGEITHFFSRIQVVVLKIKKGPLKVGDKIRIRGTATDFTQTVRSMQIESVDVRLAKSGQVIGLKVDRPAIVGDKVYKIPR